MVIPISLASRPGPIEAGMLSRAAAVKARLRNIRPPRPQPQPQKPVSVIDAKEPSPPRQVQFGAPFNFLKEPGTFALVKFAALKHGLRVEDIMGRSRLVNIIRARHEAIWLVKSHRPWMSLPEIGRIFNIDHTTVLHAIRKQCYAHRRVDRHSISEAVK